MENISLLASVPLFTTLDTSQIADIAANTRREQYERADVITREGDSDARLFIIADGSVNVYKSWGQKNQRRLRGLDVGNWFGEIALLLDQRRTATVVAATDVEVLSLSRLDLEEVIRQHPGLCFELMRTLAARMQTVEDHLLTTLGGFIPICAECKSIRDEDGRWARIEDYFSARTDISFSHTLCPQCNRKLNPELFFD